MRPGTEHPVTESLYIFRFSSLSQKIRKKMSFYRLQIIYMHGH